MSEELVVRHCSPTLAGLKTGNMFTQVFSCAEELKETLRQWNRIFVKKGLRVIPLRNRENRALLYVFRPAHLQRDLEDETARRLLRERGYGCRTPDQCLLHLMRRLDESKEFPHEIGLFLGYPPEDVCGFIENKEAGRKCVGCWCVYGDEEAARRQFAKYKKCTAIYCAKWAEGRSLEHLTVRNCAS